MYLYYTFRSVLDYFIYFFRSPRHVEYSERGGSGGRFAVCCNAAHEKRHEEEAGEPSEVCTRKNFTQQVVPHGALESPATLLFHALFTYRITLATNSNIKFDTIPPPLTSESNILLWKKYIHIIIGIFNAYGLIGWASAFVEI